jgi:serine/threonine-protein kinase
MATETNVPSKLGRFEVVGFLAAGGMAEVFLGRVRGPSGFERPVVLKRVLPHLARQTAFVDMFLDEARIVARIQHPNVVAVNELTRDEGELFMVMEYLEGESVAGLSRRVVARGRKLPPALAAYIVAEACAGLHAAHELVDDDGRSLGVVHRDVSPQNVFVTFAGGVKVLDFGIAKAADRVSRTETGQLKGKLDYMSPEQCRTHDLDRRSDVFSLGVVLYELLTQRRLFKRPTPLATMKAITEEPVLPPSRLEATIAKELDAICAKALARDRDARYATCADLRRELMAFVARESGGKLPEEELAALMGELFADRKREKEDMLRRVREGSRPTEIPSPETDDSIEIPVVVADEEPVAAPRSRSRIGAIAAVLVLAAIAGIAVVLRLHRTEPSATEPIDPAPHPVASAPPTASTAPRMVQVAIETTPPGAHATIAGVDHGATPLTLSFPMSSERSEVVLAKDGYVTVREPLALGADQHLKIALAPSARALPAASKGNLPAGTAAPTADPMQQKW